MANRAITSLDLAANELDEYAGQELAHALLKNRTLTALDLTGNYVPEEWLRENHKVQSRSESSRFVGEMYFFRVPAARSVGWSHFLFLFFYPPSLLSAVFLSLMYPDRSMQVCWI